MGEIPWPDSVAMSFRLFSRKAKYSGLTPRVRAGFVPPTLGSQVTWRHFTERPLTQLRGY